MGLGARLPIALDAIPIVRSTSERAARYPDPDVNQRVQNLGNGAIERWNGASWVTDFLNVGNTTGTPAVLANGTQVLLLPAAINFAGRVVGTADGSTAVITVPDLPILAANGTTLEASPKNLKFTGSGVSSAVDGEGAVTVTITAGGGIAIQNHGTALGTFTTLNLPAGMTAVDSGAGIAGISLDFSVYGLTNHTIPIVSGTALADSPLSLATGLLVTTASLVPDSNAGRSLGALLTRFNVGWFAGVDVGVYAAPPIVNLRRRNGTVGAPTDVTSNQVVGTLLWTARVGGADIDAAYIKGVTEDPGTQAATEIVFGASSGSTVPADVCRVRVDGLYPAQGVAANLGDSGDGLCWAQVFGNTVSAHVVQPTTFFSFDVLLGGSWPHPGSGFGLLSCGAALMRYEAGNVASRIIHEYVGGSEIRWYPNTDGILHLGKAAHGLAGVIFSAITTPGSPVDGELYRDSADGGLYYYDGTDLQGPLGAGGGGGGGKVYPLADQPATAPSDYDDEFTGTSLDAKWTVTDAIDAGAHVDFKYMGSLMRIRNPGFASANFQTIRQTLAGEGAAGTPFWVTCKVGMSAGIISDLLLANIELGDSATYGASNFVDCNLSNNGSGHFDVSVWDGSSHGATDLGFFQGFVYMHCQRSAGNVMRYYVSFDGISWRCIFSASKTFDIDYLFLRLYGSTTPGHESQQWIDWFRVNDPRFKQEF